jgi:hypothetical protein
MIHLVYDDILSPVVRNDRSLTSHLSRLNIPFTVSNILNNNSIYVLELFRVDLGIKEIFDKLGMDRLLEISKSNTKILIYFPYEGFDLELYGEWFKELHLQFKAYNMCSLKKYFIFNNMFIEEHYERFLKSIPECISCSFERVFGYPFFYSDFYFETLSLEKPSISLSSKEKDFLCLNSQLRPHRVFLVSELIRRGLDRNSFISLIGTDTGFDGTTISRAKQELASVFSKYYLDDEIKSHCMEFMESWEPMLLDVNASLVNSWAVDQYLFDSSYFSLVTETGLDFPLRFTEKVFKPIINMHPFIVQGCAGTLKYLQSLGFHTFPELFDESYDNIENSLSRVLAILDQVEKFSKLPKYKKDKLFSRILPKLEHNYNLFKSSEIKHSLDFKHIMDTINND